MRNNETKMYVVVYSSTAGGTNHRIVYATNKEDARNRFLQITPKDYNKLLKIIR